MKLEYGVAVGFKLDRSELLVHKFSRGILNYFIESKIFKPSKSQISLIFYHSHLYAHGFCFLNIFKVSLIVDSIRTDQGWFSHANSPIYLSITSSRFRKTTLTPILNFKDFYLNEAQTIISLFSRMSIPLCLFLP